MNVNDVMVRWADAFVVQYGGEVELSTSKIKTEVMKMDLKEGSIIPSDHCYNRVNNDPTSLGSKTPLFIYLERNKFKCVGSKYEYNDQILCRPRGNSKDNVWGYYDNKLRKKIHCPETTEQVAMYRDEKIPQNLDLANNWKGNTSEVKTVLENVSIFTASFKSTKPLDLQFFDIIEQYLKEKQKLYDSPIVKCVEERNNGRKFSLSDHLRGYIYAQLSNNRPWAPLEPHLPEIDEILCNYDVSAILNKLNSVGYEYFVSRITRIKCGNRGINAQMQALEGNIKVFTDLIDIYGSLDEFVKSRPVIEVITMLSDSLSRYKLRTMGIPLTAEYLRNVGVDCPKPDVHLCRILGNERLGLSSQKKPTAEEVFQIIAGISEKTGYPQVMIDNVIWSYCAEGYGAICSSNPKCNVCVIKDYCRFGN